MFFTINEIRNVIIEIDEFSDRPELLTEIVALLSEYSVIGVSAKATSISITSDLKLRIIESQSRTERQLFQNTIRRALEALGGKPSNSIYIAGGGAHLRNAHEVLLGTVIVRNAVDTDFESLPIYQNMPDALANDATELLQYLSGSIVGYGGEVDSAPPRSRLFKLKDDVLRSYPLIPNPEHPEEPTRIAGRYFEHQDPRHSLHALSIRLLNAKSHPERHAKCFGSTLAHIIDNGLADGFDIITAVPSRPGQENRLAHFLYAIPEFSNSCSTTGGIDLDLLQSNRHFEKMKNIGAAASRRANISGAIDVKRDISDAKIVLVDDIRTTGSTLNELIKVLKKAGARSVEPIVLGYHPFKQDRLALTPDDILVCSRCNEAMVPRTTIEDGAVFYGCSGYGRIAGPHDNMDLFTSMSKRLQRLEQRLIQLDPELQSEHIPF